MVRNWSHMWMRKGTSSLWKEESMSKKSMYQMNGIPASDTTTKESKRFHQHGGIWRDCTSSLNLCSFFWVVKWGWQQNYSIQKGEQREKWVPYCTEQQKCIKTRFKKHYNTVGSCKSKFSVGKKWILHLAFPTNKSSMLSLFFP